MRKQILFFFFFSLKMYSSGISPSVLMFHEWDLDDCEKRTSKALSYNKKSIHYLLTGSFIAFNKEVVSYCFNTTDSKCTPVTGEVIHKIQEKIQTCLKDIPIETEINISFHLNDTKGNESVWRNEIIFDPLAKYEGVSYEDFLITPILLALESKSNKEVRISLQGEMGATLFSYPKSYSLLIQRLKSTYPQYKFGVSTNYNKISGKVKGFELMEVQGLLDSLDFLGFSAYKPFNPFNIRNVFQEYADDYLGKLRSMSLSVPSDVELLFSEIGLGGGNWKNDGRTAGENIEEVSAAPYAGIFVEGKKNNPWKNEDLFYLRRRFFLFLDDFLSNTSKTKEGHHVSRAFVWNAGSWDIHGIYPGSENFKDHLLTKKLAQ